MCHNMRTSRKKGIELFRRSNSAPRNNKESSHSSRLKTPSVITKYYWRDFWCCLMFTWSEHSQCKPRKTKWFLWSIRWYSLICSWNFSTHGLALLSLLSVIQNFFGEGSSFIQFGVFQSPSFTRASVMLTQCVQCLPFLFDYLLFELCVLFLFHVKFFLHLMWNQKRLDTFDVKKTITTRSKKWHRDSSVVQLFKLIKLVLFVRINWSYV